jgi:hypothetical protein
VNRPTRTARLDKAYDPSQPRDEHGRWVEQASRTEQAFHTEQVSHFAHATLDLLTRVGHATSEAAALIVSVRALRSTRNRLELAKHLGIIATDIVALRTHLTALPEEARVWSSEAKATLEQTRETLVRLKRRILGERSNDTVNKIAHQITSLMAGASV